MTFEEKYKEIYSKYLNAAEEHAKAEKKLSEIHGFGGNEMSDFLKSKNNLNNCYSELTKIDYLINEIKIDPDREYVWKEFILQYIKNHQSNEFGLKWNDDENYPGQISKLYEVVINVDITNDNQEMLYRDINNRTTYKFISSDKNSTIDAIEYIRINLFGKKPNENIRNVTLSNTIDFEKPFFISVKVRVELNKYN